MRFSGDLKNCRVMIKDTESGQLIADTRIMEYDAHKNILKIRPSSLTIDKSEILKRPVYVLIFGTQDLYECIAQIRIPVIANEVEVYLFGGKEKEGRKNQRYDIQIPGKVEAVVIEKQRVVLHKPIEFTTKNISGSGILIQTMTGSFEKGDLLQVLLEISGNKIRSDYKVVRKQNDNVWTEEYGCKKVMEKKR